jgi:hypothetical protein
MFGSVLPLVRLTPVLLKRTNISRMLVLSAMKDTLALLCPPSSPLATSIQRYFSDPFVAKAPESEQSVSAERLHATAEALLLAGRILQHVHTSRASLPVDEGEYDMLTAESYHLADFLMRHGKGHTWPFCGPIIITLKSVSVASSFHTFLFSSVTDL